VVADQAPPKAALLGWSGQAERCASRDGFTGLSVFLAGFAVRAADLTQ
jgi:hypothetical protein